jgi:hypothetical protein
MKSYHIWSKSWDNHETYHGEFRGCDFRDAVINFKCSNTDPHIRYNIDIKELTYFGSKFYEK